MPLSKAQTTILKQATDNNGYFDPALSSLKGGALQKVTTALINKALLESETDQGYLITDSGKEVLGITNNKQSTQEARKGTKTEKLINMLRRKNGATNAQIQTALDWQPHSVRGIISGTIKKKMGFDVIAKKNKSGNLTYRITN